MNISADVERLEAEAWAQMHGAWAREAPGATTIKRWGWATALRTPGVEAVAVNRVIGMGLGEPLDRRGLAEVREFYRAGGTARWFLEWSPEARSAEKDLVESAGGQLRDRHQAKMFARVTDTELVVDDASVQVVSVSHQDRASFRDLVAPLLGVPEAGRAGIVAPVGQTGWYYYLAWTGGEPIAGAAMFSDGRGAWFGLAATLPAHRNNGAQSALLSARIRDARALGCEWVSAETYPPSAEANPSLRNMARMGMRVLYHRPFYRFDEVA